METPTGAKIYKLPMLRDIATKDLTQIKQGCVLSEETEINNKWKVYFERLLNEEKERSIFELGNQNGRKH
jgi:hypothetical protein